LKSENSQLTQCLSSAQTCNDRLVVDVKRLEKELQLKSQLVENLLTQWYHSDICY